MDWEAYSDRHERARSGVGFKETDATTGQRVHSTWTTLASPSIFLHPCPFILNDCVQPFAFASFPLPPLHFPSFPSFSSSTPSAPVIWVVYPTAALVYGQEARESERWAQCEREEGTSEEMERHCSRVLTSDSAPLQLLDVFNSSLCLLSRHCGGLLKQQPQVATFSTRLG